MVKLHQLSLQSQGKFIRCLILSRIDRLRRTAKWSPLDIRDNYLAGGKGVKVCSVLGVDPPPPPLLCVRRCSAGYYGNPTEPDGRCRPCECSLAGSLHPRCDTLTGRCECKPGVRGHLCEDCEERHVLEGDQCVCEYPGQQPSVKQPITSRGGKKPPGV